MGWLNSRKPQGFHHTYIYIDERNEAVRRLRQSRVEAAADEASLTAAATDAEPSVVTAAPSGDAVASSVDASAPSAASAALLGDAVASSVDASAPSAASAAPSGDDAAPKSASATPMPETLPAGPLFVSALAERRRQSRDAAMRLVGAIVVPLLMLFLVLTIFIFLL